jgi:hypothetical protein
MSSDERPRWHRAVGELQAGLWHWIPQESLTKGVTREQVVEGLRALLALPVEVMLPAHGAPTDRAALERALS